jgi:Zn-dependent protease
MKGAKIPIGRVLGVPVALHLNWVLIFALVWIALGGRFYPQNFPQWSAAASWAMALVATLIFFATVLGHEIAHALVARWRGVPVRGITLSFLGGAAEIERDADRPVDELLISGAGPLSSLAFAGGFYAVARLAGGAPIDPLAFDVPAAGSLVAVTADYLATINFWLAAFNAIPAFPLDGGRVLRGLIWLGTRDFLSATRLAAWIGRAIGSLFILYGLFQMLRGHVEDLWYLLIGWFLNSMALQSEQQVRMQAILRRIPVARLMHRDFPWVQAGVAVRDLVYHYFTDPSRPGLPVIADGRFAGLVTWQDLQNLPPDRWDSTPVGQIMTPYARLRTIQVGDNAEQLLRLLQNAEIKQAPVLEDGRLVGMVGQDDILSVLNRGRER